MIICMHGYASLCLYISASASASGAGRRVWVNYYWTKCGVRIDCQYADIYAAATVWRIVVCTFGRFTTSPQDIIYKRMHVLCRVLLWSEMEWLCLLYCVINCSDLNRSQSMQHQHMCVDVYIASCSIHLRTNSTRSSISIYLCLVLL